MIQNIEISMKSFEFRKLEETSNQIEKSLPTEWKIAKISFPRQIKKFTLIRSPHIDKKSREQFELRTHKKKIFLHIPNLKDEHHSDEHHADGLGFNEKMKAKIFLFLENLKNLHPSGVQIQIELVSKTSLE